MRIALEETLAKYGSGETNLLESEYKRIDL